MAKFKKKKSKPTPDPEIPKTEETIPEAFEPIPKGEGESDEPPAEPAIYHIEKDENSRKLNRLFWLRVVLAVIAGTAATFVFEDIEGEERRWASIAFMILLFVVTIVIAKGMNMQLPRSDRKKVVTQGIGSYVFIYLFMWIVSYTLANLGESTGGISSPIS